MPDCPKCKEVLAFNPEGARCTICGRKFTPYQVSQLPGYDDEEIQQHFLLYQILLECGLLDRGINTVEFGENDLTITHKGPLS